jgi:hypothetical protein
LNLQPTGRPSDTHSGGDSRPGRDHLQVSAKLELEAHRLAQRHSQECRQPARQRSPSRIGTAHYWLAQRHSQEWRQPASRGAPATRQARAQPRGPAAIQGLRDADARPQGPLHSRRHSLRQQPKACATRMHAHRGLCIRGGTAFGNNPRPARLGCTPSAAPAPAASQPSFTRPAQQRSVTSHCGEDNRSGRQQMQQTTGRPSNAPAAATAGPADCTHLNQLRPFVRPFVGTVPIVQPQTIFKHPGSINGAYVYRHFRLV